VNIEEYIQSGIIETYVLGLADADEQAEFERMCAAHHEVRLARDAFEKSIEQQALQQPVAPPKNAKSKIFAEIEIESEQLNLPESIPNITEEEIDITPVKYIRLKKIAAAASVILLVGSTLLNLYFFNKYKSFSNRYNDLLAQQNQTANNNNLLQTKVQQYEEQISHLKNPRMLQVKMPATTTDTTNMCTVYWDAQTKDVYLMVNNLPKPSPKKQYQLWAIVDGAPVSVGMVGMNEANTAVLLKMHNIPKAEAFCITLENEGGSAIPTMSAMYVMGKV